MKPIDQLYLHNALTGVIGDCERSVIASLLELPIEKVPHFGEGDVDEHTFHLRINTFLRQFNMGMVNVPLEAIAMFNAVGMVGIHHEISGPSPRYIMGYDHAVVGFDGKIVHDPHPSREGVREARYAGIFIILDPSKLAGKDAELAAAFMDGRAH